MGRGQWQHWSGQLRLQSLGKPAARPLRRKRANRCMPAASRKGPEIYPRDCILLRPRMAHDILIVDDEPDIRMLIDGILADEGYETRAAEGSDAALAAFHARRPSLVMLDVWLQGSRLDGIGLLE